MEDKRKVIFIEDDPNLGLIIVLALQSKGYEVYYANTLSGIQDMIEKDYPNILLLDLEVGNQNALDYLPFIRSKHPSLPVLIASSHNEGEEITRCYEAGANHYTKKPYDIQEIDFLIQRFVKRPVRYQIVYLLKITNWNSPLINYSINKSSQKH